NERYERKLRKKQKREATTQGKVTFLKSGSPGGTRTPDQLVNSQLLYRLSYRGILKLLFVLNGLSQRLNPLYRLYELQLKADQPMVNRGNTQLFSIGLD